LDYVRQELEGWEGNEYLNNRSKWIYS
jgi:hypothetical protein